jgi:hypothetical protein
MAWSELGTLTLTYSWQEFGVPAVGSETFRLSMPGVDVVDGYALLRPYYPIGGAGFARRCYPTNEQKVMTFIIPPDLKANNEITRYFQACLSTRARVFAGQSWNLKLEVFY